MARERDYDCSDIDMLIASGTICQNFRQHQAALVAIRTNWADPFIDTYNTRIDTAMDTHLGVAANKDQKAATRTLYDIQQSMLNDLSLFKMQVEMDFDAARVSDILILLGFSANYSAAARKDQEALIKLLYQFKNNMDASLQGELVKNGMQPTLISGISAGAAKMKDAEIQQETLKTAGSTITAAASDEFNAIYKIIIGICKIGNFVFKDDETNRLKFSFSHVVSAQSSHPARASAATPADVDEAAPPESDTTQ